MSSIANLYKALKADPRLQKDWEKNQPRVDRAFEAPLIARTPREVATASLLATKLKFEPAASRLLTTPLDHKLREYAVSLGGTGTRLLKVIDRNGGDGYARAAAIQSLQFYWNRAEASELLRLPWSDVALKAVANSSPQEVINAELKPTFGVSKTGACLSRIAAVLLEGVTGADDAIRRRLRSSEFPVLGPERADAVGVFAFKKPWPIMDDYLWLLLHRHGVISDSESQSGAYDRRRSIFEPHWLELIGAFPQDRNEIAATLYLWAVEAEKYHYSYEVGAL